MPRSNARFSIRMEGSRFNPRNRLPAPNVRRDTLTPVPPRVRVGIAPAPASERATAPPMAAAPRNCLLETLDDNEPTPCTKTPTRGCWLRSGRRRLSKQVHDGGEELRPHLVALRGARDVAHDHLQPLRYGPQVGSRTGRERMRSILARHPLPILFSRARVGFSLLLRELADLGHGRIRVAIRGQRDVELVPEPLPGGREIEIVVFDRERVHEGHASARGMARAG